MMSLQPYERMNVADALVSKSFEDGDQIITQVGYHDAKYNYVSDK